MPRYIPTLYSWITLAGGLIALLTTALVWSRRHDKSARILALLTLLVAEWGICNSLEYAATDLATTIFWAQMSYLGVSLSPVLFLVFSWSYGRPHATLDRHAPLLLIVPLLTFGIALTNQHHHLLWSQISLDSVHHFGIYSYGAWFYVFVAYTYTMILLGIVGLIVSALQSPAFYLPQRLAVLMAAALPVLGNLAYLTRIGPLPGMDWTPPLFALMAAILAWSMRHHHLFELEPLLRSSLMDTMEEGVLLVDERGRIADMNKAMLRLWPTLNTAIGQPCAEMLSFCPELSTAFAAQEPTTLQIAVPVQGNTHIFEARTLPLLRAGGQARGHLAVLYDVTEEQRLQTERDGLLDDLRTTLSHVRTLGGLLPICANCKKIRDDQGYWQNVEVYLADHSEAEMAQALCPECLAKQIAAMTDELIGANTNPVLDADQPPDD